MLFFICRVKLHHITNGVNNLLSAQLICRNCSYAVTAVTYLIVMCQMTVRLTRLILYKTCLSWNIPDLWTCRWSLIVQRLNDKFGTSRALYDKSMKLGTIILDTIRVILKTGGILDSYRGDHGSHFPRWSPVNKIVQYVNHKSHVQSLIVDIALVNNTWHE